MPTTAALRGRVGDLRQLAAVRRIVLDDGPERGVRALAFSTGGGLDFWALTDRSLDLGPLWWRGRPVAWEHPSGYTAPGLHDAEADGGTGIGRSLSGFLVTCGLAHSRQPAGGAPLHGRLPLTPARLFASGVDWDAVPPLLFAEGEVVEAHLDGPAFRLRRRIEAAMGGGLVSLRDRVEDVTPEPRPLHLLYHLNLGYPTVCEGVAMTLNGEPMAEAPGIECRSSGPGERFAAVLDAPGCALRIEGCAAALPYVQTWRDPRPGRGILAIEPATSDRAPDGTSRAGPILAPGEAWRGGLDITFGPEEERPWPP